MVSWQIYVFHMVSWLATSWHFRHFPSRGYMVYYFQFKDSEERVLSLGRCKIFSHRFCFWICLFPPYVRIYILACNKIVIYSMYLFNKHVLRVLKHFYLEYAHNLCVSFYLSDTYLILFAFTQILLYYYYVLSAQQLPYTFIELIY